MAIELDQREVDKLIAGSREYFATPRRGPLSWVYVIGPARLTAGGALKIGVSASPADRLCALQTGNHVALAIHAAFPGTHKHEKWLHRILAPYRIRGEHFRPAGPVIEAIRKVCDGALLGMVR